MNVANKGILLEIALIINPELGLQKLKKWLKRRKKQKILPLLILQSGFDKVQKKTRPASSKQWLRQEKIWVF